MAKKSNKELIDTLSNLISEANAANPNLNQKELGRCEWIDVDNNERCNDHWSEFQCQQVDGAFSRGEICDEASSNSKISTLNTNPGVEPEVSSPRIAAIAYFDDAHDSDFDKLQNDLPEGSIVVLDLDLWYHPDKMSPETIAIWRKRILDYQQKKIIVLGYVPTDSGTGTPSLENAPFRPQFSGDQRRNWTIERIKGGIDLWYEKFQPVQPNGIFLDEGPSPWRFNGLDNENDDLVNAIKKFYIALYKHVHTKDSLIGKAQTVMLNAAGYWRTYDDWVLGEENGKENGPSANVVVLFEGVFSDYKEPGGYTHYPIQPPAWWTNHGPERVCHVINKCPEDEVCNTIDIAKSRTAGYVYVYDGTAAAYSRLPSFWQNEVSCIKEKSK